MQRIILLVFVSILLSSKAIALENYIVAVVDDSIITEKEMEDRKKIEPYISKNKNFNNNRDSILKSLIKEKVIISKGKALGIIPTEEEIDITITQQELASKLKKSALVQKLKSNNLSIQSYRSKIASDIVIAKIVSRMWKSNDPVSTDNMYSFLVNANQVNNFLVRYQIYSSKDLTKESFNNLLKLQQKIRSCDTKINNKSINLFNDEAYILSFDKGIKTLLSDSTPNVATNIIKKNDQYQFYLVCNKQFPYIQDNQKKQIKSYMEVQNMESKIYKMIDQWEDNSSIHITQN